MKTPRVPGLRRAKSVDVKVPMSRISVIPKQSPTNGSEEGENG